MIKDLRILSQTSYPYQPASIKKLSYSFSLDTISFFKKLPENKILLPIGDQLLKSSTSIGANIIDANTSSSSKESKKYFEIALKSARKSEYWLLLLCDSYQEHKKEADSLVSQVQNIRAMLELTLESIQRGMDKLDNDYVKQ